MYRIPVVVAVIATVLGLGVAAPGWAANGYGPQAGSNGGNTIECDSSGSAQQRCPAPGWTGARLVRQLSHAPCTEGETWGFDQGDGAVWVDNGCRGEFALLGYEGNRGHSASSGGDDVVECASTNGEMSKCSIPSWWQGVRLVKQLSHSACSPGEDFGYDHRGKMWVDNGCRGRFANDSSD